MPMGTGLPLQVKVLQATDLFTLKKVRLVWTAGDSPGHQGQRASSQHRKLPGEWEFPTRVSRGPSRGQRLRS